MVNFNFDDAECGLTPQTMAVLAEYNELGKIYTRVLEKDNEFTIPKAPREVIDNACRYFGSSLESCQEGTREICDFSHKTPIVINLYCGMFFFPIISPQSDACSWISHSHILTLRDVKHLGTEIIFDNDKRTRIIVNVSYGSMTRQLLRTSHFRYKLISRLAKFERASDSPFKAFFNNPYMIFSTFF